MHWEHLREAQSKHRLITQSEQERSCILLLRLQTSNQRWTWVHVVLQVKDSTDSSQQPVIVCTNQVLSDKEAAVMRANSWLYQFYSLHSKMHFGLAYDAAHSARLPAYYATAPHAAAERSPTESAALPSLHNEYPSTPGVPEAGRFEAAPVPVHYHPYHHASLHHHHTTAIDSASAAELKLASWTHGRRGNVHHVSPVQSHHYEPAAAHLSFNFFSSPHFTNFQLC